MYKKRIISQVVFRTVVLMSMYSAMAMADLPVQYCIDHNSLADINPGQELRNIYQVDSHADVNAYINKISHYEADGGAFDNKLIPELVGLGLAYRNADMHREASDILQRTLHLIRVNEGLDSINQLHVIELLIESNTAIKDWEKVANNHDLMYWIYKRNYSLDEPRFLPLLKKLRTWYLQSYNKKTGHSLRHLYNASEQLYKLSLEILVKCTGNMRDALCFWHKGCCSDNKSDSKYCPVQDKDSSRYSTTELRK